MTLKEKLDTAMKDAMRAKDALRLNAIRMAKTAVTNKEKEGGTTLDDQAVIGVLSTLVKQRRESAEAFRATRPELAAKEEQEMTVLQEFLPAQLSDEELQAIIEAAVAESGASSPRDMGAVMKLVTPRTTGRADGRRVSELVKARLAG